MIITYIIKDTVLLGPLLSNALSFCPFFYTYTGKDHLSNNGKFQLQRSCNNRIIKVSCELWVAEDKMTDLKTK